ncbi:hypothetical protein NIES3585_42110 [Nodularia sp. NIES-3585]|nr:hypothetical protein NIES3585_42110 [Nodularia sp. NIES-3585]
MVLVGFFLEAVADSLRDAAIQAPPSPCSVTNNQFGIHTLKLLTLRILDLKFWILDDFWYKPHPWWVEQI